MNEKNRSRNEALLRFILLPFIFLTVALLGGLRIGAEDGRFIFIAPPLITLMFAVLLIALFIRGSLLKIETWFSHDYQPTVNDSHALTLLSLFFASAQAFNSVLPERGLFFWLFSFFFLWTLWNNLFSVFDAKRLLRSLIALFGMAFILKHLIVASFNAPEGSWWRKLAGILFEGLTLGFDNQTFAPATGYISFFTLILYMVGLYLLPSVPIASKEIIQTNVHLIESETIEAIAIEDDEITQVTKK
jgi:intracellular septation protein A